MKLWSDSFGDGEWIPTAHAMGKHNPETNAEFADNKNPHLAWDGAPEGTRSFAIVCVDVDVPSVGDNVNKPGATVAEELPRVNFYHWVAVDFPATTLSIAEGAVSDGVTPRGKPGPGGSNGTRHGTNDYTAWFAGDDDMAGSYFGYDGPFPPWNDERVHHYHFTVYALDVERCPIEGEFDGPAALAAIEGHVVDKATVVGSYAINPSAAPA